MRLMDHLIQLRENSVDQNLVDPDDEIFQAINILIHRLSDDQELNEASN